MTIMVTPVEVGILILAVVGLLFAQRLLSSIKMLATNAVVGIIALIVASWFGFGVSLTPLTLAVTALAGVPGAILMLLLAHSGVAFMPTGASGELFVGEIARTFEQFVSQYL